MEKISKKSDKFTCESQMEGDGISVKVFQTEQNTKRLLYEIRNIRAKEVWIV